jgi:diaminohydroxyphosphoribosylaminopyrimidine deaminase / 5-amino-6-(5-phosphoribosylamino)uracil reductase
MKKSPAHLQETLWMQEALALAQQPWQSPYPNPRVGAVIVKDGVIVGRGYHARAGEKHAEVMALQEAGALAVGATLYCTLEPCAHQGRTDPCVQAVIEAGIKKVVLGMRDPNALVNGLGIAALKEAGLDVVDGLMLSACEALNPGFISLHRRGRPFVSVKIACSLDGKIALKNGQSQWITCEEARRDGHIGRAQADVIMTGVGTVLADDPRLTVRSEEDKGSDPLRQVLRLIVDRSLRTPSKARLFQEPGPLCFVHTKKDMPQLFYPSDTTPISYLEHQGSLQELLVLLGKQGHQWIWVEAGAGLLSTLWKEQLVDEWIVYMAPCFLGGEALSPLHFSLDDLAQVSFGHWDHVEQLGNCVRMRIRQEHC